MATARARSQPQDPFPSAAGHAAANGPAPTVAAPVLTRALGVVGPATCEDATDYTFDLSPAQCTGHGTAAANDPIRPVLPNGDPYPGDLVHDILEYRGLRAGSLAGRTLRTDEQFRLAELQGLLCAANEQRGHSRAYHRFDLHIPATLRVSRGPGTSTHRVGVDNISAGGVKLLGAQARVAGERVELSLKVGNRREVALPARVAWLRDTAVGLMFAGAARWR